jgi:hypothetical protein
VPEMRSRALHEIGSAGRHELIPCSASEGSGISSDDLDLADAFGRGLPGTLWRRRWVRRRVANRPIPALRI